MIFVLYLRNFYLTQGHINFILPFFSNFIVSSSTFEFFIHFEIIFMYGWGSGQSHLFIYVYIYLGFTVQFSSVAQLCPTPCNPMDCSTPGLPVHHRLPGVYSNSCPWSQWCHPTISSSVVPFSFHLQSFPASGSFPMSQFFVSGGQNIGVSASASVLPMNIQDWSPLEWTGWISLQSKGLSRVFSNTTVQKHQFFGSQLSL